GAPYCTAPAKPWRRRVAGTTAEYAATAVAWEDGGLRYANPPYEFAKQLLRGLEHRDVIGNRGAAHVEDAAELCVRKLHALGSFAGELHCGHHMHGNAGGADRMALGLQAAGRIDRQLAVLRRPAFQDRARTLPLRRQAHRFIFDQLGDGEAVVG